MPGTPQFVLRSTSNMSGKGSISPTLQMGNTEAHRGGDLPIVAQSCLVAEP